MAAATQRKQVKVRFIDSVAGLGGNTNSTDEDGRPVIVKNQYGLRNEYSFRPGEVAMIDSELADKWVEGCICEIVPNEMPIHRPALHT